MKATGITRQLDPLGRIVLPMELRRNLNLNSGDSLEIYVEGENIILKKYGKICICCGNEEQEHLIKVGDIYLCSDCVEKLKQL